MINILYGLLADTPEKDFAWYKKRSSAVPHTDKMNKIIAELIKTVPPGRRCLFACFVCNAVKYTQFGHEIATLDSNNTYADTGRQPDAQHDDTSNCIYAMTCDISAYQNMRPLLDEDIRDRLGSADWIEMIAAGCLQLLREVAK